MSEQQLMPAQTLELAQDDPLGSWLDPARFRQIEIVAEKLARSRLVPKDFQGKPEDCFVAVQYAARLGVDPFPLMQNMFVLYGRPCLSAQMKLALFDASGKFPEPIQYETGSDETQGSWCRAWAKTKDGTVVKGPIVSMKTAKDDGWYGREGSKWKTIPQLMLMYRAADWFIRIYGGNALFGLPSVDEVFDAGEREVDGERIDVQAPEGLRGEIKMPEDVKPDPKPEKKPPAKRGPRVTVELHNGTSIPLPPEITAAAKDFTTGEKELLRGLMKCAPDRIMSAIQHIAETLPQERHGVFQKAREFLEATLKETQS